jgi:hypothetical protein
MPRVGFEPKTQMFEQVKTVHALDIAATVIASMTFNVCQIPRGLRHEIASPAQTLGPWV